MLHIMIYYMFRIMLHVVIYWKYVWVMNYIISCTSLQAYILVKARSCSELTADTFALMSSNVLAPIAQNDAKSIMFTNTEKKASCDTQRKTHTHTAFVSKASRTVIRALHSKWWRIYVRKTIIRQEDIVDTHESYPAWWCITWERLNFSLKNDLFSKWTKCALVPFAKVTLERLPGRL